MTGWPGSDSPNFMDADHEGYISDQKRIAELEQALRSILSIYESEQLEDAEAMDEVGKIARNAIKI